MYRILLAEDDSALRYVYSKMSTWTECGFVISAEVSNGKAALEMLEKEEFDLVVTDIRMPFVDGLQLLSEIREKSFDVFSILVSSYSEFEYARQGLILGAFDYIVKPVTKEKLKEVLERAKIYLGEHNEQKQINDIVLDAAAGCGFLWDCSPIVKKTCEYLSANIGKLVSMDEVAETLGFSKDYYGKSFKQATNVSFINFHKNVKVCYAKKLMVEGAKNYEICEKLGYSDPDYFTRIFKEIVGMTPAQYKKAKNI